MEIYGRIMPRWRALDDFKMEFEETSKLEYDFCADLCTYSLKIKRRPIILKFFFGFMRSNL